MKPLVNASFKGVKVSCFAYGQTGSGKTFTMLGPPHSDLTSSKESGMFLLSAHEIFEKIKMVLLISLKKIL